MDHRLTSDADRRIEVQTSVLAYLHRHPEAADTLDGIVNWWLPRQRLDTARQRIEAALEALVAEGRLCRHALPGGTVLYALANHPSPRAS
ncbi:hypothetical protein RKE25_20035 [Dyella sp. BiH032]|uniref:hypothetical protein n=1 Tax=Dyella sp. BiH032 TaxID=3075430 RepID=UPI0028932326|nr:hypothetical protein [Dyella sp. BiH032]WNL45674.1 hypothetical protein RKE25_20035 [Dyella sp. BiH032]